MPRRLATLPISDFFSFSPRGLYSDFVPPLSELCNNWTHVTVFIIVCLWYLIETSSICDSYWSRYYHDDTGIRVLLPETLVVSDRRVRFQADKYVLLEGELYFQTIDGALLKCIDKEEAKVLMEEIHEGVCRSHLMSPRFIKLTQIWMPELFLTIQILELAIFWSILIFRLEHFVPMKYIARNKKDYVLLDAI